MKQTRSLILFALFLVWGMSGAMGQNNTLAAGGDAEGSGGSLSYSVGQVDYIEATGSGGTANQGVQQPFEIFVLGDDVRPDIQLEMVVYPNPTIDQVTLRIGNFNSPDMTYQLYDINGRLLKRNAILNSETLISFEDLSSAIYLLQVMDHSSLIKSFRIIKK